MSKIVATLKDDPTLTAMVPSTNIMVGPVDVLEENQTQLVMPQINLYLVSETSQTVPLAARETVFQLDIWSRISQLEVENIYEQVLTTLNFLSGDNNGTHIFWQRLNSAVDDYQTDRRIFHKSCTFMAWVQ
jgi:hypothetical protein